MNVSRTFLNHHNYAECISHNSNDLMIKLIAHRNFQGTNRLRFCEN